MSHSWYTAYPGSFSYSQHQAFRGRGSRVMPEIGLECKDPAAWQHSRI